MYGSNTRSYNNSTEKRQMDQVRKESTDRHLGLCSCGKPAIYLCAWKVPKWQRFPGNESDRCDRPMCPEHAKLVGPEKFLCPEHQNTYDDWKKKQVKQGSLFEGIANAD
jgi:hypothetical protein